MLRRLRVLAPLLGLALALALSACGGDDEPQPAATATEAPAAATQTTAPTTAATTTTAPQTTPETGGATTPATTPTAPQTTPDTGGATTPATTPTAPRTTPSGGAPADCPGAVGGFIRDVRASDGDCGTAGAVAQGWFDAIDAGQSPDAPIDAAGHACSGSLNGDIATVTCRGADGTVTFTASP